MKMNLAFQFFYLTAILNEIFISFSHAEALFNNHIENIRPITNDELLQINHKINHKMNRNNDIIINNINDNKDDKEQEQQNTNSIKTQHDHDDQPNNNDAVIAVENDETNSMHSQTTRKQKLTIIGYASDAVPAKNLIDFSQRYDLDFHLIGTDKEWGGFNTKITGFYDFISAIDNTHNDSIILILDAYDTVPICNEDAFLEKFNEFNADIVIATGKDCWPDPNLEQFLTKRMSPEFKETHPWFPWYLCPNSGAMMGYQNAMLSMLTRVRELVMEGNGSCNDFEGNSFSRHTQSDQRCYTSYYVDLLKHSDMKQMQINLNNHNNVHMHDGGGGSGSGSGRVNDGGSIIDISVLNQDSTAAILPDKEDKIYPHYKNINMVLDHTNALFASMGGMMFSNYYIAMNGSHNGEEEQVVIVENKITETRSCVLHGNGPGVILWRSFVKQIRNNGQLYVDDHVLRIGSDFFHFVLWWLIMPLERLSHWMSMKYHVDLGVHSTTFSEDAVWNLHFVAVALFCTVAGVPVLCWYKYKHKANQMLRTHKRHKSIYSFPLSSSVGNSELIGNHLKKQLLNLEIMVHHNGTSFSLLKTEKKN